MTLVLCFQNISKNYLLSQKTNLVVITAQSQILITFLKAFPRKAAFLERFLIRQLKLLKKSWKDGKPGAYFSQCFFISLT